MRKSALYLAASVIAIAATAGTHAALAASEPPVEGAFTLVVLPDTQNYADVNQPHLNRFYRTQTEWIAANVEKHNIKYVLHLGDIVQHNREDEFPVARDAHDVLIEAGIPFAMTIGNHDAGPNGNGATRESLFDEDRFFGRNSPYAKQASIGGFLGDPGTTANSWHKFEAGGKKWMIITLEWGPRDIVLAQAGEVIAQHPDHNVILTTHANMFNSGARYNNAVGQQSWNPHTYGVGSLPEKPNDGQEIWDKLLKKHPNIKLIMNGHVLNDGTGLLTSVGEDGQVVHQALSDFQVRANGGDAWLRLLEFYPDGETVRVRTYSPALDRYDMSIDNDFTIAITDRKVMNDHVEQTLAAEPKVYYRLASADGAEIANEGGLGTALDAKFEAGADETEGAKPYKFDGDDAVATDGSIRAMRRWTVATWVRTVSEAEGQNVLSLGSGNGQALRIALRPTEGAGQRWTAEFGTPGNARATVQDISDAIPYNWYHLAVTSDGKTIRFYVDGMLAAEDEASGQSLTLGRSTPVIGKGLKGEVGELAIFDRQLTYGEVTQLHRSAFHRVIAGNIVNHAPTIDANNGAPVTVINQSFPGISVTESNRGDHELFLGNAPQVDPQNNPVRGTAAIAGDGVMLATVRRHARDGVPASVEVGWNSFADGVLSLSTTYVGRGEEVNTDTSVAWFSFVDGWTVGHVDRQGRLIHGNSTTVDMIKGLPLGERGRYIVDLGVNSEADGMLFVGGAANANRLVAATPREAGAGWDLKVVDNANGQGIDGDFSFLYLRHSLPNLIAGAFDGVADASKRASGDFDLSRQDTGKYLLSVPGESPETGMLLLSAGDVTKVAALSYEGDQAGNFVIQALDPATATPMDTAFNWAFISFENPIEFEGSDDIGDPNIVLPPEELPQPIDPLVFASACVDTYAVAEDRDSTYDSIEGGTGVVINGNGWKRIEGSYEISSDTILEFEFSSSVEGEVHAIGFDFQDWMTLGRSFKVFGTQNWGLTDYDDYEGGGAWKKYTIPVGQFYTGSFDKLFFVNDRDGAPVTEMESRFRNIKIYAAGEAGDAQPLRFDRCDIKTHGGTEQDFATHEILDGGSTIKVVGNGYKRVDVPYYVTPSTVLEFEFRSTADKEGEVHAIGLDFNNNGHDDPQRAFKVFGVQDWGNQAFDDYDGNGEWKTYRIPVGQYYTGATNNIFFVNDDDRPNPQTEAYWRNVRVYEGNLTN